MRALLLTTCSPDDRKPLAAARALGRAGWSVDVAGDRHLGEAYYSRYVNRRIRLPHPADGVPAFLSGLERHVSRTTYQALLPMNDYTTLALGEAGESLRRRVGLAIPSPSSLARAQNKQELLAFAAAMGIAVPATRSVTDRQQLEEAVAAMGCPCVIKLNRGAGAMGLTFLERPGDLTCVPLLSGRSDLVFDYDHLLVQEVIPGQVHDVCVLMCRGEARAVLTQKRLLTYPPSGGSGVLVETTREPELAGQAVRLLEALDWHGPAQVEFIVDDRDGVARLMEVNGRFWGTLDLSIRAGIDFPLLTCRLARDGDVEPVTAYRVGLRYRWPFPYGLLHTWESGRYREGVRAFFGGEGRALSDLWPTDPLPALAEAWFMFRRLRQRRFRLLDPRTTPWRDPVPPRPDADVELASARPASRSPRGRRSAAAREGT